MLELLLCLSFERPKKRSTEEPDKPAHGVSIAVIGAGLTGFFLVVSLLPRHNYKAENITAYEQRTEDDAPITREVALGPNGLRMLDAVGVLERVAPRCWVSVYRTVIDEFDQDIGNSHAGGKEKYGYNTHRLWRNLYPKQTGCIGAVA